jgi:ribosomal protein S6
MKLINKTNNYELMVILSSHYTEVELKTIAFYYAQQLKKLGASDINLVSRGCRNFAYLMKGATIGYFVEMYFNASPQILSVYKTKLKLDKSIIRYTIKNISKK